MTGLGLFAVVITLYGHFMEVLFRQRQNLKDSLKCTPSYTYIKPLIIDISHPRVDHTSLDSIILFSTYIPTIMSSN